MPIPKSHQAAAQSLITVDRVEARGYDQPVSVSLQRFRCLKNYHSNHNDIFMHEDPGLFMIHDCSCQDIEFWTTWCHLHFL